jgi:hypothetical protein
VIDLPKRYVHVEAHDDPRITHAQVTRQVLTRDEALQTTVPALLALLDALPEDSPFLTLDPPQRRQQPKSWELRAAVSLSRLWQWQG